MSNRPSTSNSSEKIAREKRLKEALRANLQRRRQKALAGRLEVENDKTSADTTATRDDGPN